MYLHCKLEHGDIAVSDIHTQLHLTMNLMLCRMQTKQLEPTARMSACTEANLQSNRGSRQARWMKFASWVCSAKAS